MLPCSNLTSGIAKFTLGLQVSLIIKSSFSFHYKIYIQQITRAKGKFLPGTPLRFTLRKECNLNRGMKSSTLDSTPALLQGSVLIFMLFSYNPQMLCAANFFSNN